MVNWTEMGRASYKNTLQIVQGKTRRAPSVKRTLYQNFAEMLNCFHEAGHVVVTHSAGLSLYSARAGRGINKVRIKPFTLPVFNWDSDEVQKSHYISALQRIIDPTVAGVIAELIHLEDVIERGYSCRQERTVYTFFVNQPVSSMFARSDYGDGPTSDVSKAVRYARELCTMNPSMFIQKEGTTAAGEDKSSLVLTNFSNVPDEIVSSERRAEVVLKSNWAAVCDIATALHRSKTGHLNRKQLLSRLDRFGVTGSTIETDDSSIQ